MMTVIQSDYMNINEICYSTYINLTIFRNNMETMILIILFFDYLKL